MRFKVPQNVQRADQILLFITLPQLIILLITGGISYMLFTSLNKTYYMGAIQNFLTWTPLMIGAAFAFIKIKGLGLSKFLMLLIEQLFFLPRFRYWQTGSTVLVSVTTPYTEKSEKKIQIVDKVAVDNDKFKNLAALLDGEKPENQK